MLCQLLLYSKVIQLYVHIYPLFLRFPSHLGHQRALSRAPCDLQQVLTSYLLSILHSVVYVCQFQFTPLSSPLLMISLFSTSVTVYALQIRSSIPFFQIPYISDIIQLFVFLLLTYFCMTISRLSHVLYHSFLAE